MKKKLILEILLRKSLNTHPHTAKSIVKLIKNFKINMYHTKDLSLMVQLVDEIETLLKLKLPSPLDGQTDYRDLIKVEKRDDLDYNVYFNGLKTKNLKDLYVNIILELQTQIK